MNENENTTKQVADVMEHDAEENHENPYWFIADTLEKLEQRLAAARENRDSFSETAAKLRAAEEVGFELRDDQQELLSRYDSAVQDVEEIENGVIPALIQSLQNMLPRPVHTGRMRNVSETSTRLPRGTNPVPRLQDRATGRILSSEEHYRIGLNLGLSPEYMKQGGIPRTVANFVKNKADGLLAKYAWVEVHPTAE